MSLYDMVKWDCPSCGARASVEAQSKALGENWDTYDPGHVPIEIAADVLGDTVRCAGCDQVFRVRGCVPMTVVLSLEQAGGGE